MPVVFGLLNEYINALVSADGMPLSSLLMALINVGSDCRRTSVKIILCGVALFHTGDENAYSIVQVKLIRVRGKLEKVANTHNLQAARTLGNISNGATNILKLNQKVISKQKMISFTA